MRTAEERSIDYSPDGISLLAWQQAALANLLPYTGEASASVLSMRKWNISFYFAD